MRVTVLGSGSGGNATLVEGSGARLLIDAGFSGRNLERRLAAAEVAPESITALLVTHDHRDHTSGVGIAARRWGMPLYMTTATHAACQPLLRGDEQVLPYRAHRPLTIGGLAVHPFLTVHDAADPVAVTVTENTTGDRLGIATDLGRPTAAVRHALSGCHLLMLEANHDEVMLRHSPYPWSVQARIASSHGHLSNRAAAELAKELHHAHLCDVVLAHLSERANHPEAARDAVGLALERSGYRGRVEPAGQHVPLEPVDITELRRKRRPEQLSLL